MAVVVVSSQCPNLIVYDCAPVTFDFLTDALVFGGNQIELSLPNLHLKGIRKLRLNNVAGQLWDIELIGQATHTVPPYFYDIVPSDSLSPIEPQQVQSVTDCYGLTRKNQLCTIFRACVSATANQFTYNGALNDSQLLIEGYWQGRALKNGIYSALLKTDDAGSPGEVDYVRGSVRIVPWPTSRLRYKPFGNKIRALWTNNALTDATKNTNDYLAPLNLPPGV
jgi:hypothetical protein